MDSQFSSKRNLCISMVLSTPSMALVLSLGCSFFAEVGYSQMPTLNRNTAAVRAPVPTPPVNSSSPWKLWGEPQLALYKTGLFSYVLRCSHLSTSLRSDGVLSVSSRHIEYQIPATTVSQSELETQLVHTNPRQICPSGAPGNPGAYPTANLAVVRDRVRQAGILRGGQSAVRAYGAQSSFLMVRGSECNDTTTNFAQLSQRHWLGDRHQLQRFCQEMLSEHRRPEREQAERDRYALMFLQTQENQRRLAADNARLSQTLSRRQAQEHRSRQRAVAQQRRAAEARRRLAREQEQQRREDARAVDDVMGPDEDGLNSIGAE